MGELIWLPWVHRQDLHSQLHRRRVAAARSVPLDCGGRCRDPWSCHCETSRRRDVSDRWIDAGAAAAAHLLELGYIPLLETAVLRALWRRGGRDRELAQNLYDLAGGDA